MAHFLKLVSSFDPHFRLLEIGGSVHGDLSHKIAHSSSVYPLTVSAFSLISTFCHFRKLLTTKFETNQNKYGDASASARERTSENK